MKKFVWIFSLCIGVLLLNATRTSILANGGDSGDIVIANRASGTISVISADSNQVVGTYALPAGDNVPEPMYVTYASSSNKVFVGDRANSQVVVFNADDYAVDTTIPTGEGVFHMWSDPRDLQLWVNNDVDKTITVIDPVALTVRGTVSIPADLVADGYKPHDVILDPSGFYAYVTLVGGAAPNDYLVQFNAYTFGEVNRVAVGKDPHVSLTEKNNLIYVPSQDSNVVSVFNRYTLAPVTDIPVPGAHGAGMAPNGKVFYTTNIPNGGVDGLFAIDTRTNSVIGTADTPYAVPHNVAVSNNGKLYVTHSGGSSDKVTIYAISGSNPVPSLIGEATVGFNPFGLAYVP